MVWIVCQDSDDNVLYKNSETGEMTRQIPRELIEAEEKKEKELLQEYQRLANEIGGMWGKIDTAKQNMKESQQTIDQENNKIEKEKSKCIQIEHDIAKLNEQMRSLDLSWKPNGRIEELPAEILFHIFKQLFDLKSVSNCYNTNLRWKKIVEKVLKNSNSKFSFYTNKVIKSFSKGFKINLIIFISFSKNNHSRRYRRTAKC